MKRLPLFAASLLLAASAVRAQTTGAIVGIVKDGSTGQAVAGAIVEATSPQLMGKQTAITKHDGNYRFPLLPAGKYKVVVRRDPYRDGERTGVVVNIEQTMRVDVALSAVELRGGEQEVVALAPMVDQGGNTKGVVLNPELIENLATSRQLTGIIEITPGATRDATGTGFGGATGLENTYIIDGVNTTDIEIGSASTNMPTQFIQQVEVKTAGYQAEFGRANGAVINAVTKSGGNEFHGNVWFTFENEFLRNESKIVRTAASAVGSQVNQDFLMDFGVAVGGYIVKDRVWFYAGLQPTYSRSTIWQIFSMRVDDDGDNKADRTELDLDGDGKLDDLYYEVERRKWNAWSSRLQPLAKITFNLSDDHAFELGYLGSLIRLWGVLGNVRTEAPSAMMGRFGRDNSDLKAKWTSQLFGKAMSVEAQFSYHREQTGSGPITAEGHEPLVRHNYQQAHPEMLDWDDPNNGFIEMPVKPYYTGGWGFDGDTRGYRYQFTLGATNFVKLMGNHQIKYGLDVERMDLWSRRGYTGGYFLDKTSPTSYGGSTQWLLSGDPRPTIGDSPPMPNPAYDPNALAHPWSEAKTRSFYHSYYLRDSWTILSNVGVNVGMRFERQELRSARNEVKFITGRFNQFDNGWSPRIGANYDWTNKGDSKFEAFFGRFYEEIPTDINNRAFGNEAIVFGSLTTNGHSFSQAFGGEDAQVQTHLYLPYLDNPQTDIDEGWIGPAAIEGQYHDEISMGYEQVVIADLKVGLTFERRYLGRVIEDISVNNGNSYIIANPGFGYARAVTIRESGQDIVYEFAKPKRDYNAIKLVIEKRLSRNWQGLFSYTWAHLRGNYPGLYSPNNGQVDPNISSQYDLPDMLANRDGDLDFDVRHSFKLDGSYEHELGRFGSLVAGGTFRLKSGVPINVLGKHPLYGSNEVFILPRASGGRTPWTHSVDLLLKYKYKLAGGRSVGVYIDIFNVFNTALPTSYSSTYSTTNTQWLINPRNVKGVNYQSKPWTLEQLEAHTVPDWLFEANNNGTTIWQDDCPVPPPGVAQTYSGTSPSPFACKDPSGNLFVLKQWDGKEGFLLDDNGGWLYRHRSFNQPTGYQAARLVRIGLDFEF